MHSRYCRVALTHVLGAGFVEQKASTVLLVRVLEGTAGARPAKRLCFPAVFLIVPDAGVYFLFLVRRQSEFGGQDNLRLRINRRPAVLEGKILFRHGNQVPAFGIKYDGTLKNI